MANIKHVDGRNIGNIMVYALSTCAWCKRTKKLLNDLNVSYDYIDVDLESEEEQYKLDEIISVHNPYGSFPTIVIDDNECIIGFKPKEIKERFEE